MFLSTFCKETSRPSLEAWSRKLWSPRISEQWRRGGKRTVFKQKRTLDGVYHQCYPHISLARGLKSASIGPMDKGEHLFSANILYQHQPLDKCLPPQEHFLPPTGSGAKSVLKNFLSLPAFFINRSESSGSPVLVAICGGGLAPMTHNPSTWLCSPGL